VSTLPSTAYRDARTLAPRRPRKRSVLSATVLRLRVAVRHDSLDSALARGADPASRPQLAMRAAQLERPRHRRTLARTLRRVVDEATGPRRAARPTAVVIARKQILAHANDVLELAVRLDCPHPAHPTGIAIAQRLVTDAVESPLYVEEERSALNHVCRQAVMQMGDPYA
jgi:hypothetical protein